MDFNDYNMYLDVNGISSHSTDGYTVEHQINPGSKNPGLSSEFVNWNEQNPGIGIGLKKQDGNSIRGFLLGYYLNSLGKNSNYIAYLMQHRFGDDSFHADTGMTLGAATGYDNALTPMVQPTLTIGGNNMDINFRYQPAIENVTPSVVSANASYRLPK